MRIGEYGYAVSASADDLSATGDSLEFRPGAPVRVIRWGLIASVAVVHNSCAAELNLTTHSSAGAATETASGGKTLLMAADAVVGEVLYVEPTSEVICRAGDILQIEITSAATSGSAYGFIEYQQLPTDLNGVNGRFSDDTTARYTDLST
jgi:hypothetical protein